MSYKNPTVTEVLENSTGLIANHFHKTYLNLARSEFSKRNGRKATLDDAQAIRNIYEEQWVDYYLYKPRRVVNNKELGRPIWEVGVKYGVDVYYELCRFIEMKYGTFIETPDRGNHYLNKVLNKKGYYIESCNDLINTMNIEFIETHIIKNGLLDEWFNHITNNHKVLKKWTRRSYFDFSEMAYNGVANDF